MTLLRFSLLALALSPLGCGDKDEDDPGFGGTSTVDGDGDGFEGPVGSGEDCNDSDASINPEATEICDDVDQDCDEAVDEEAEDGSAFFSDADGDGYGDPDVTVVACEEGGGATLDDSDCDDGSAAVNPGESEAYYDGVDNDCDPSTSDSECSTVAPEVSVTLTMIESFDFSDGAAPAVRMDFVLTDPDGDLGTGSLVEIWWGATADGGADTGGDADAELGGQKPTEGCEVTEQTFPTALPVDGELMDYDTAYEYVIAVTDKGGLRSDPVVVTGTTPSAL